MSLTWIIAASTFAMALHISNAMSLKVRSVADAEASMLLPSFDANGPDASETAALLQMDRTWWTRVGSRVYHAPGKSSRLSSRIEDYYYGVGSMSGLTDELRANRVGGEGRWHIFHFPTSKPSLLQKQSSRRSSLSTLRQLKRETTLGPTFPQYTMNNASYSNPLSEHEQEIEKDAVDGITPTSITEYLEKLVGLKSRTSLDLEKSGKAVALLQSEFKAMGFTPCLHKFEAEGMNLVNVIAHYPGETADMTIVGAHYDSIPAEGAAPGAEDNGSGAAALLAMARAFKNALGKASIKPHKSVYFVAFAGEEQGLLGSAAFAAELENGMESIPAECKVPKSNAASLLTAAHRAKDKNSVSAIIMDEIGWVTSDPKFPKLTVNLESYDWCTELMDHLAASSHDHNGDKLNVIHSDNPFGSDHMSFLEGQMPAVLTINGDDEAYPNYHQSTDTIENVNADYAAMITKMNMGALARMALPR